MFSTKRQVQNDHTNRENISCFCQTLQFRMYLAIKTPIFQLRPLLRFLYLINSFYRRYVSCMYDRSNISNVSNISNISIHYATTIQPLSTTIEPLSTTIQPLSNHYPPLSNHYPTTIQPLSTTIQPLSNHYPPLNNHYPTTICEPTEPI